MASSSGEQELLREDVLLDLRPRRRCALGLDAEELLLVVPLVQRLGLVEPLVALEADEPAARHVRHRLGQLRLARPRRALHEDRLAEAVGQVDDAGDALVGQVVHAAQGVADGGDGLEAGHGAA
jgi:hypothetical protein